MKAEITLGIKPELDALTRSINAINKSMRIDLGLNIENAISDGIKKLKIGFKNNMPVTEINELRKKIKDATKVKLKLNIDQATNQLKTLGTQAIGTYATIKAFISNPVSINLDFNTAINEINKFSNFSTKELAVFKKDIWSLGKTNGLGMNDILKMSELSAQLGVAKTDLKAFTQNAINLKIGLGLSQEEAVNLSTSISKAFNMGVKDIEVFSDEVTAMANSTGQSGKKILEVTKSTLAGAKAFGLSAKETSALSSAFLSVGLDSSEASSSINKFFTELNNIDNASEGFKRSLTKMGLDAQTLKEDIANNPQEAIKSLFVELNDLDDEERFGVISEIFGKKMANNINSAKDGIKAFEKALESSKDSAGALSKAVDRAAGDGFGDSIFELKAAWSEFKSEIGSIFVPTLKYLADVTRNILGGLTDFLQNHQWSKWFIVGSVGILTAVKSIGLFLVAIKPIGTILFYPLQILWKSFVITNYGLKTTTLLSKICSLSIKGLSLSVMVIKNGFIKASLSIFRFCKSLFLNHISNKLTTISNYILKASIFALKISYKSLSSTLLWSNKILGLNKFATLALAPAFKIAGVGVSWFSKTFRFAMTTIKGALISTGIGALIVGLGFAIEYAYNHWEGIKGGFVAVWEWIKEGISPVIDWFKWVFEWISNGIGGIIDSIKGVTDFLGITDDKAIDVNKTTHLKGSIDEVIAKQNENKAKMLSSISSNDNSRQINDYKTITINTNATPQAIASAINSYSYDDEF